MCLLRKLWVCELLIEMMSNELEVDHLNLNVVTYIRPQLPLIIINQFHEHIKCFNNGL